MEIYDFAQKWLFWFQNGGEEDSENFRQDCRSLGFSMDCGQAFISAFPHTRAFQDAGGLEGVIDQVEDPELLGSALFSKWRWITHWEYHGDLRSEENCRWFTLALTRMVELTQPLERPMPGKIHFLRLISEKIRDGDVLCRGALYEQQITLFRDGRAEILDRYFGEKDQVQTLFFPQAAERIDAIWEGIKDLPQLPQRRDAGRWTAYGIGETGEVCRFSGNLGDAPALSDFLRRELRCHDLLCMDGRGTECALCAVTVEMTNYLVQLDEEGIIGSWETKMGRAHFQCSMPERAAKILGKLQGSRFYAGGADIPEGDTEITAVYETGEAERIRCSRDTMPQEAAAFLDAMGEILADLHFPDFLVEESPKFVAMTV